MPIQLVWISEAMQNVRDNNAKMTEDEVNQYLQYYFMVKRPAENAEASKAWLEDGEEVGREEDRSRACSIRLPLPATPLRCRRTRATW